MSKLFAKVISRQKELLLAGTELTRNIFKKDIRRLLNTYNFNTTK